MSDDNSTFNEQLRVALVMNGGVSLAVWIGGVTREFGRMVAGESAYGDLLKLTCTSPRIDVISGTSAGGINGAFLAMALAHHATRPSLDSKIDGLRELWLGKGSIADLLRDPIVPNPPSILDGDSYFYEALREAFEALRTQNPTLPGEVPIDLIITTTLLNGRTNNYADDFGSRVVDVVHRGKFTFRRGPGIGSDPFADRAIVNRLALAARSTASFPGAFEASFCPVNETSEVPPRPDMKGFADFEESHFVIDGGVLDNKPLDVALDSVFHQRAAGPVRRVLAYVVPDPETTAGDRDAAGKIKPDKVDDVPAMLDVVIASMVDIPPIQSISEQLSALQNHNTQVRARRHARILLTQFNTPVEIDGLALKLFAAYRSQRILTAVDYIVDQISQGLLMRDSRGLGTRRRLEWLSGCIADPSAPWIPSRAPVSDDAASERSNDGWKWGTRPIEHMSRLLLDIVRRAQRMVLHMEQPPSVADAWRTAFNVLEEVDQLRKADRNYWQQQARQIVKLLDPDTRKVLTANDTKIWLAGAIKGWNAVTSPSDAQPTLSAVAGGLALQVANTLIALRATVEAACANDAKACDPLTKQEAIELRELFGYFVRSAHDTAEVVVSRLLAFEVVQDALGGRGSLPEQELDFVQVTAAGASTFGGPSEVASKLAGVQLAHFGAFYKSSWRANDWMWGRLDAIRRIVRLLLDPERLRVVVRLEQQGLRAKNTADKIAAIALDGDQVSSDELSKNLDQSTLQKLIEELAYLDDPDMIVPDVLPTAIEAVSRRLELEVLRKELPIIASAIEIDRVARAQISESAESFFVRCNASTTAGLVNPDAVGGLLALCAIGKERFDNELGTDKLTTVTAQIVALTISAVQSQRKWFKAVGSMLEMLRAPALLFYLSARNAQFDSRSGLAFNAGLWVAGLVILLTAVFAPGTYNHWVLGAGAAALLVSIVIGALQLPRAIKWALPAGSMLGVALLYYYRESVRTYLTIADVETVAIVETVLIFIYLLSKFVRIRLPLSARFGRKGVR